MNNPSRGPSTSPLAKVEDPLKSHLQKTDCPQPMPLSHGQHALWFLHQSDPQSAAYNIAACLRIHSKIAIQAIRRAFQHQLERHAALRTVFSIEEGHPVQRVASGFPLRFEHFNAADLPEEGVRRRVIEAYKRPFILIRGPLMRAAVFSRSQEEHILLLAAHHIVCDSPSLTILLREFQELYAAECESRPAKLPEPTKSFFDFVHEQNQWLHSEESEAHFGYWKEKLSGELPLLLLPKDHPRPPVQRSQGDSLLFELAPELTQGLKRLAETRNTGLFEVLLAAFKTLLHRCSGQRDIILGTAAHIRREAYDGVVGNFLNSLVLRSTLEGYPTFAEFLKQVQQTVSEAVRHKAYPFSRLVERLQPNRDTSRMPLFQAMFIHQPSVLPELAGARQPVNWGPLRLEPYYIPQLEGQFDLTLEYTEWGETLRGVLKYNTDLFDAETVERFRAHYRVLLQSIVESPNEQLTKLPILSEPERRQLLYEFNQTQKAYPLHRCLHHWVEDQARRTPNAPAVVNPGAQKTLTYTELNARANRLAHYLQKRGTGPDVLIGVCMERSLEMVIALLAVLKAGGAYVPLDPASPRERLRFTIQDSHVPVLLTQHKFQEALAAEVQSNEVEIVPVDSVWRTIQNESADPPTSRTGPEHLAYCIYTSGSSGKPKGALNTHKGICNRLLWMQDTFALNTHDAVLQKTPYSFDVSVWEFFWPLMTGARLVTAKPEGHKDSSYLINLINQENITTLHFVPSMLQAFVENPEAQRCASIKRVICSGEALPYELQERFFQRLHGELHNLYGPTEAAIDVTHWQCRPLKNRRLVPIGRPIANIQIYILDKHLEPVPIGVAGELHIGGVGVAREYLARPELNAEKFIPNPHSGAPNDRLYKTGDLARMLPDGTIEYLARIDKQVKIRGHRIEIGEIESVLARHPNIREAVVMARPDQNNTQYLAAYFVSRGAPPNTSELRRYLLDHLPDYMIPSIFVPMHAIPLSPNGKIDYAALPEPDEQRPKLAARYVPPQSPTEHKIAKIWQEALPLDQVGIYDNFFELGGHSLHLGRIQTKLRRAFNYPISMIELFRYPTIHALADHLSRMAQDEMGPR